MNPNDDHWTTPRKCEITGDGCGVANLGELLDMEPDPHGNAKA